MLSFSETTRVYFNGETLKEMLLDLDWCRYVTFYLHLNKADRRYLLFAVIRSI